MVSQSYQARVPPVAAAYFACTAHPIVVEEFRPGTGWVSTRGWKKRISASWARTLRRKGVTHVSLLCGGRQADFSIAELLRR